MKQFPAFKKTFLLACLCCSAAVLSAQPTVSVTPSAVNVCVGDTVDYTAIVNGLLSYGDTVKVINMTTHGLFNDTAFGLICGQTYDLSISGTYAVGNSCGGVPKNCTMGLSCPTFRFRDACYDYNADSIPVIRRSQGSNRITGTYTSIRPYPISNNLPDTASAATNRTYNYSFISDGNNFIVRFSESQPQYYLDNCGGLNYVLTAGNSSFIYDWDFGDGATLSGTNLTNPNHAYSSSGTYTVKCRITPTGVPSSNNYGSACRDSFTVTINVLAPNAGIIESYYQSTTATLTATPYSMSYWWQLPSGGNDTVQVITATDTGIYILRVTDNLGCTDTVSLYVSNSGANTGIWPKQSFGTSTVRATTILADSDANVYINGVFYGQTDLPLMGTIAASQQSFGYGDHYIMKVGECPWFIPIPSGGDAIADDMILDRNGNILAGGNLASGSGNVHFILHIDGQTGSVLNYSLDINSGNSGGFVALAASKTTGNIYAAGRYWAGGIARSVVYKFDSNLTLLATDTFGQLDPLAVPRGIALDANDNVYVPVNLATNNNFASVSLLGASILKYSANLVPIGALNLTSSSFDRVQDLIIDATDTLYAVGATSVPEPVMAKLDVSLTVQNTVTANGFPDFVATACDADSQYLYVSLQKTDFTEVITGRTGKNPGLSGYMTTHSISSGGQIRCNSVAASKGIMYIAGSFHGQIGFPLNTLNSPSATNMFAVRFDTTGTSFKTDETVIANTVKDEQVFDAWIFPNPGKGELWVKISGMEAEETLSLQVWDMLGKSNGKVLPRMVGDIAILDMRGYAPGFYTVEIKNGKHVVYKKVSVVR